MNERYRWVMLSLAFLTGMTLHLTLFSYSPLIGNIISDLHITHLEAGAAFSAMVVSLLTVRVLWGFLVDMIGLVWIMKASTLLIGLSGILRGFAFDYVTFMMFQLLIGVGLGAILPCLTKIVSSWFPSGSRGLPTGIYVAGFPVGGMIALTVTPLLLNNSWEWRGILQLYGIWCLILMCLWWFIGKELKYSYLNQRASIGQVFKKILRLKSTWILAGIMIISMGIYDTLTNWLPYILQSSGVPLEQSSLITQMLPLGFLISSITVGAISDIARSVKPLILIFSLLSGIAIYTLTNLKVELLIISVFIVGFCEMALLTIVLKMPTELEETVGMEGGVTGIISSIANIGPTLFPVLMGYIKDVTGSFTLALIVLAVLAVTAPLLGFLLKEE